MQGVLHTCRRRAPVALLLCLVCASTVSAGTPPCTKLFVLNGDTDWHVDANWDPAGVPGPADVVCILEGGDYQVMVTEPVTIAGLYFDSYVGSPKVKILGTDFTLNGDGYLVGNTKLKVNDGAVLRSDGDARIEVHSKLVIDGGTVEIDVDLYGHLNFAGVGSLTGALVTHPGSSIEYEDTGEDAHLVIAEGFDNHGEVAFVGSVAMTLEVVSGALVNSADGVISAQELGRSGAFTPELRAEVVNHGLIEVDGLDLRLIRSGSQHENGAKGTIQVTDTELEIDLGGLIDVPSNFTNYGTTTVAGGGTIRVIGSAGALDVPSNFTNYGTTTVAGGGTIRVIGSAGATDSTPLTFINAGFVDIESAGLFAFTDAAFSNLSSGWVRGSGTLELTEAAGAVFDGTVSPGFSPGILTVDGDLGQEENARIAIEVGGETPGADLDRLDVTQAYTANGSLEIALVTPYHPQGGERYEIMTYEVLAGWFNQVSLPVLQHLLEWNLVPEEHSLWLETVCQGIQLGLEFVPDRDPVSIDHELIYHAVVTNHSQIGATELVVTGTLPPELVYRPDLSSIGCVLIGSTVECSLAFLAPAASWQIAIGAEPVVAGPIGTTALVGAWECDTDGADDQATATFNAVAAAPCDANYDLAVDSDDLVAAAAHIFGENAAGNPDCRLANGITADDLAAIIEASQ